LWAISRNLELSLLKKQVIVITGEKRIDFKVKSKLKSRFATPCIFDFTVYGVQAPVISGISAVFIFIYFK